MLPLAMIEYWGDHARLPAKIPSILLRGTIGSAGRPKRQNDAKMETIVDSNKQNVLSYPQWIGAAVSLMMQAPVLDSNLRQVEERYGSLTTRDFVSTVVTHDVCLTARQDNKLGR